MNVYLTSTLIIHWLSLIFSNNLNAHILDLKVWKAFYLLQNQVVKPNDLVDYSHFLKNNH